MKLLKATAWLFILMIALFSLAFGLFYLNQNAIKEKIVSIANESQPGYLEISSVELELFYDFPNTTLGIDGLKYYESKEPNATDSANFPILKMDKMHCSIDMLALLKGNISLKSLVFEDGYIGLRKHEDGTLNLSNALGFDILAADTSQQAQTDTAKANFENLLVDIQKVSLDNIIIDLENKKKESRTAFKIDNITTSFQFQPENVNLNLDIDIELLGVAMNNKILGKGKKLQLNTSATFDRSQKRFDLAPSTLILDAAAFNLSGYYDALNDGYVDAKIEATQPDIQSVLSLLSYQQKALKRIKHENGSVSITASAKGPTKGQHPHIDVDIKLDDIAFSSTETNVSLRDFNLSMHFDNGDSNTLESSTVLIDKLEGTSSKGQFNAYLKANNLKNPHVIAKINADLDLKGWEKILDLQGISDLDGQLQAVVDFDQTINLDNIHSKDLLKDSKKNGIILKNISFKSEHYDKPIQNINGVFYLYENLVGIHNLQASLGENKVKVNGNVANFSSLIYGTKEVIKAKLDINAEKLILSELLSPDSTLSNSIDEEIDNFHLVCNAKVLSTDLLNKKLPEFSFEIENWSMDLKNMADLKNLHGIMGIKGKAMGIKKLEGVIGDSDFKLIAGINNFDAIFKNNRDSLQMMEFGFDIESKQMKMEDLTVYNGNSILPSPYDKEALSSFHINGGMKISNHEIIALNDSTQEKALPKASVYINALEGTTKFYPLALRDFKFNINLDKGNIDVSEFKGKLGKSDFSFTAHLKDFDKAKKENLPELLKGEFAFNAKALDLNELMSFHLPESKNASSEEELIELQQQSLKSGERKLFKNNLPNLVFEANIDEIHFLDYDIKRMNGTITSKNKKIDLENLSYNIAKGDMIINGFIDGSQKDSIKINSSASILGMNIEDMKFKMTYEDIDIDFTRNFEGTLDAKLTSNLTINPDLTVDLGKSEAKVEASLKNGRVKDFAPMEMLSSYFGNKDLSNVKFDEIKNSFVLEDAKLVIPKMDINSTIGHIKFSGEQDLNMNMEYYVDVPLKLIRSVAWNMLVSKKKKEKDGEDEIQKASKGAYITVNVKGNMDDYNIGIGKKKAKKNKKKDKTS
ncbi:AsmA-like C-terminal region-containing protein [Aureibacter tunicatorum]|uniref:AsmA-like C-terminal domain-containing protein n=1 Tax=Aureibacter tunicatorum TaxID=866807 RepID=A0AAE3XKN1_9BACT|nr:AsmA-like C-terminal region-containing protein [Aureibacter tunicatorum]MDR6238177.1 hypothetical protein [Aureibacter tunicatorum]BDD03210.1 hypothetical protein AUTU_06930 [Aureibacter tunicatorum]